MNTSDAKQALISFLERIPAEKRKHLTAVTPRAVGQDLLYHMSRDNSITQFSPSVTKRTAGGEDRSIPRISTATTWAGCVKGYQADLHDFEERKHSVNAQGERVDFTGGWVLYGLPFEYALFPGPGLVPDSIQSGEHWLVTYDKYTLDYTPVKMAKIFYTEICRRTEQPGSPPTVYITAMFEVFEGYDVRLGGGFTLPSGYWEVKTRNLHGPGTHDAARILSVKNIPKAVYDSHKNISAGLLSIENEVPASLGW